MRLVVRSALGVILLGTLAGRARAQEGGGSEVNDLPQPTFWEGGGIKLTEGTIFHPSVDVQTGYQSNVFYQNPADSPGQVGAVVSRVGVTGLWQSLPPARLDLEAPGGEGAKPALDFSAAATLTWNQYFGSLASPVSDLAANLLAGVTFNPQGELSIGLRDGYTRFVNPGQNPAVPQDRDKNEANVTATWKPGGGALQLSLGYTFTLDVFESSVLSFDNRFSHMLLLGGRWQWLPKTAISVDASLGFISANDSTYKPSSIPLRAQAGIATLITPVFGVILKAGYGNGFYAAGPSPSSYLATLELRYAIGPTIRLAGGYNHDFADSLIGNYYSDHTLYARGAMQFAGKVNGSVRGELRFRGYDGIKDTPGVTYCGDAACTKTRNDVLVGLVAGLDYQITQWLIGGLSYTLQVDSTPFFIRSARGQVDRGDYVWNEVMAHVAAKF